MYTNLTIVTNDHERPFLQDIFRSEFTNTPLGLYLNEHSIPYHIDNEIRIPNLTDPSKWDIRARIVFDVLPGSDHADKLRAFFPPLKIYQF